MLAAILFGATGCFATLGFGATVPTSGDVEKSLAPSAEVAIGFAWDFDRAFVALGTGGHVIRATSTRTPDTNVVQSLRYNARAELTLLKASAFGGRSDFWLRGSSMLWFSGCKVDDGTERDCGGTNLMGFVGATAGFGIAGQGHLTLTAGPTFWRAESMETGSMTGIGGKVFLTYHLATWKSGGGFFRALGARGRENLERIRQRRLRREYDRCVRSVSEVDRSRKCGSPPPDY